MSIVDIQTVHPHIFTKLASALVVYLWLEYIVLSTYIYSM